ncbi:MAG: hypothetical protein H6Q70_4382, partial [Firmicutes bacterium]|nr:hypothetical protein [Bacillota bacterium]
MLFFLCQRLTTIITRDKIRNFDKDK